MCASFDVKQKCSFRVFVCLECGAVVLICRRCDHGHRYCGPECSQEARRKSKLKAALKYQSKPEGKANHNKRQQEYLDRQAGKMTRQGLQSPDSRGTKEEVDWPRVARAAEAALKNRAVACDCCRQLCRGKARRGFLGSPERSPFATVGRETAWWPPGHPGG